LSRIKNLLVSFSNIKIKGGGHLMISNQAEELTELIRKELNTV
jgi:hypothetical protein